MKIKSMVLIIVWKTDVLLLGSGYPNEANDRKEKMCIFYHDEDVSFTHIESASVKQMSIRRKEL